MALPRISGILLHPTSLPGGHGCGDFGPGAESFIDYLYRAGQRGWQILPLGPVGGDASPYQARSSFAGNPLMISLDKLVEAGFLNSNDLQGYHCNNEKRTDFAKCREFKMPKLRKAFTNFLTAAKTAAKSSYGKFEQDQSSWLEDWAVFAALKNEFNDAAWWQWPQKGLVAHEEKTVKEWSRKLADEISFQKWLQFIFYVQWGELKKKANDKGISIIGDIPIYTSHDSADVWAAREFFEIDPNSGEAKLLAGAPPDYFCEDGQLWGNPIYKWNKLKDNNYRWWMRRMKASLLLADVVRIDHFRGFEAYWQVEAGEKTARNGKWIKGPGEDFFAALKNEFGGDLPLIAEDLGVITREVNKLRLDNDLPGMKILQFAFCNGANHYRPHSFEKNCVVYTGTHDNDTTCGWYCAEGEDYAHMCRDVVEAERDLCRRYLGIDGSSINWDMMRLALRSVADTAIFPMQDVLGLGNSERMNRPGKPDGNWTWRMSWEQMNSAEADYLCDMCYLFDRIPEALKKEKDVEE